jgi:ankyrin repeat protein
MKNIKTIVCLLILLLAGAAEAETSQREQLSKAIWKLDQQGVQALLDSGTSVKTRDSKGFAPLVSAVIAGSQPTKTLAALDIAQALLDAGADVNQEGPIGNTPLAAACSQTNSPQIVEFLISRGAEVNQKGYKGTSPLYHAVRKGQVAIAKILIEHGADVNAKNSEGVTALHYAVIEGMASTVELLISRGADINARDREGKTPLGWSLGKTPGNFIGSAVPTPAMSELLLKKGASE